MIDKSIGVKIEERLYISSMWFFAGFSRVKHGSFADVRHGTRLEMKPNGQKKYRRGTFINVGNGATLSGAVHFDGDKEPTSLFTIGLGTEVQVIALPSEAPVSQIAESAVGIAIRKL